MSKLKGTSQFIPCPEQSLQLRAKIFLVINLFMRKKTRPLNHSLGFHSHPTQTSFESPLPSLNTGGSLSTFKKRRAA